MNEIRIDFEKKLEPNKQYLKNEIEEIFNTNFGARIKGITLRRDSEKNRYIILFHIAGSIYSDNGSKERFSYIGEGAKGGSGTNSC